MFVFRVTEDFKIEYVGRKTIIILLAGLPGVARALTTLKYMYPQPPGPPSRGTPKIINPSTTCPG